MNASIGEKGVEAAIKLAMFVVGAFVICLVSAAVREEEWRGVLRRGFRYFVIAASLISAVAIIMMLVQALLD